MCNGLKNYWIRHWMIELLFIHGNQIGKYFKANADIYDFIVIVVDKLELCKTFPWGHFTFDYSVKKIYHMMNHFKGSCKEHGPVLVSYFFWR